MPNESLLEDWSALGFEFTADPVPDAVKAERLFKLMREQQFRDICSGSTSTFVAGTLKAITGTGLNKSKYKYTLFNERGSSDELLVDVPTSDPQSGPIQELVWRTIETSVATVEAASTRAADCNLTTSERTAALQEWLTQDNDAVAAFVVGQLSSGQIPPDWQKVLIYATEAVRFNNSVVKAQALDNLLTTALALRGSNDQGMSEVVWCAIHRIGSIIPENRANELVEFLRPNGRIDTRLAALQAVVHIFEVSPPADLDAVSNLRNRAVELARKHWDEDVFAAGENSAIAIEATVASAVLADQRVVELMEMVRQIGRKWVARKLQRRLREVLDRWPSTTAYGSARTLVGQALSQIAEHACEINLTTA